MVIEQTLSIGVAIVLLALYAGNLLFILVTHRDVFAPQEDAAGEAEDEAQSSLRFALGVLVAATVAAAGCAELVSGTLTASVESIGLPLAFLGVVPLALIGTSADLFAIGAAVVITKAIAADGETSWFEGLMLVGVYVLLAIAFLLVASAAG